MDKKIQKTHFIVATYRKLKKKLPELLLQSFFLTLGVVIALAIGNWDEDRKREKEVVAILENIQSEALNNTIVVQVWKDYLEKLQLGIDSILTSQKPINEVITSEGIILEKLVADEKPSSLLQETAWRTAQTTNLVQYFDYRIIYQLTDMYNFQNNIIQREYNSLNSLFLDRESFIPSRARTNLQMIRRLTKELDVQHENILMTYRKIYQEIDDNLLQRP